MDCIHKKDGCVKCGENAADRGISCCVECSEECSGRCEWALIMQTQTLLAGGGQPELQKLPETIEMTAPASAFDFSQVDTETADFLREKQTIIGGYMHQTRYDIGQQLKEAQDKLSKHRYGCFGKWVASLGIKESTAYELINYHKLILCHAEDRKQIESIPYTLAREIAKPNTDPQLKQAVLDGDITSHKDYQALLKEKQTLQDKLSARPTLEIEKPPADYQALKMKAGQADKLQDEVDRLKKSDKQLVELQNSISALQGKRGDLAAQINASLELVPFVTDAGELLKKLAPVKYAKPLSEIRNNEPMKESLLSLVESIRSWCDEMDDLLIRNIKRMEVIEND